MHCRAAHSIISSMDLGETKKARMEGAVYAHMGEQIRGTEPSASRQ